MPDPFFVKPAPTAERESFAERLRATHTAPLWDVLGDIVLAQPRPSCVAALWRYQDLRPLVMEAGGIITAHEAERRVLILENPGLPGESRITQSLYAGLQLILPGETAFGHRHTASALRFIVEGRGAYTAVDGQRVVMEPGDFIVTPSWTAHDHGNLGTDPVVWLDGLDIPIVNTFDTSFAERDPGDSQPARTGVFAYPYAHSRERLEHIRRGNPLDPHDGIKMPYLNPMTGSDPIRTMRAWLQWLPGGFRGASSRSTDASIFCVAEGRGRSRIGEVEFSWQQHDIFVVPSWAAVSHEAESDSVLFSFSDRPVQEVLGIWRERR